MTTHERGTRQALHVSARLRPNGVGVGASPVGGRVGGGGDGRPPIRPDTSGSIRLC